MSEWYREAFDEYYSKIYSHRDDREAEEFTSFLAETVPLKGLSILDVCCGEGRHLRALEKVGATGFGLDLSEVLLRKLLARQSDGLSRAVRGDMRSFPFKSESFDVCLSMFTSLGYFEKREDELQVLHEVWRVLHPGGLFVLDHVNSVWLKGTLEPCTVKRRGELLAEEKRTMLEGGKAVEKKMTIRSANAPSVTLREYTERVALFARKELEQMLEQSGYDIVTLYGDYSGTPFHEKSSARLIVLARKI